MGAVAIRYKTPSSQTMSTALKLVVLALAMLALSEAAQSMAGINTEELKDAMDEAEDVDEALDWTNKKMKKWGGDYKRIMKKHKVPPIDMKDMGISLAGARNMMGIKNDANAIANSAEMQALAKAENRLAAAKEDVHNAAAATSPVKRAQLEDLAQELTEEAAKQTTRFPPGRTSASNHPR